MNKYRYCWRGLSPQGKKQSGLIFAASSALAKKELGHQGIRIIKIRKQADFFSKNIKQVNLSLFYRQLATMLKAGVPLIQAFEYLANCQPNPSIKHMITTLKTDVQQGQSFAEALEKQSNYFNPLARHLIAAGEKSGQLELMLEKVALHKEKLANLKNKLQRALIYPVLVLIIAAVVTLALLIFVIPQFESLFRSFGAEIPALTGYVIYLSTLFKSYWSMVLLSFSLLILGYKMVNRKFKGLNDKLLLKIPILGALLRKEIIARFASTLALGFAAGLPLVDALESVKGVTDNSIYAKATEKITTELCSGLSLHLALNNTALFPNMMLQLVAIGEESGMLEPMLNKIANFYEEEVNHRLEHLTQMLEPIIMTILGIVIGTLVIAMYLPIFKLSAAV